MTEIYYLIAAPEGLREVFINNRERPHDQNPGLDIEAAASRRGLLLDAIAVMGDLSSATGLVTFVDWCIGKYRSKRNDSHSADGGDLVIEVTITGDDVKRREIRIDSGADAADVRVRIREALDTSEA
jgi:hypothetical protein